MPKRAIANRTGRKQGNDHIPHDRTGVGENKSEGPKFYPSVVLFLLRISHLASLQ